MNRPGYRSFRWAKRLLSNALAEWQTVMQQTIALDSPAQLSNEAQTWLARLSQGEVAGVPLADLPPAVVTELAMHAPEFYNRLRVRLGE